MAKFIFHFFGKKPSKDYLPLFENFQKRFPKSHELSIQYQHKYLHKDSSSQQIKELLFIKENIQKKGVHIILDERGKQFTSTEFASFIQQKHSLGRIHFYLGDANGFHNDIFELNILTLSLSTFTLTHEIARLVLLEQIYRAYTINIGHPYHNE